MRTIYMYLSIGFPTADHRDEMEVEDDTTDDEIDQMVQEWTANYIEFGWSDQKPKRY